MKADNELYRQLRTLSCDSLWNTEVARFNSASLSDRVKQCAVIRAVSVVFAASGTPHQKADAIVWMKGLLQDPAEKVRRYAMTAIPKLGEDPSTEATLLALLKSPATDRERRSVGHVLEKIGGTATLQMVEAYRGTLPVAEQKLRASVARKDHPSTILMNARIEPVEGLRLHLRCRKGLESIVADEVTEHASKGGVFRVIETKRCLVAVGATAAFSFSELHALRCFDTVGIVLGLLHNPGETNSIQSLATTITSPLARRLLSTLTHGSIRYRLEFVSMGNRDDTLRKVADRAYTLCPEILNDARLAPWAIEVHSAGIGAFVELRPKFAASPRLFYRQEDIPAASHPPLAACMARLAGRLPNEVVWDPFCGSGLELVETALLGGVKHVIGTDVSPEAIAIAQSNFAAAKLESTQATFACADFRKYTAVPGLANASISLIITNPPMGRRVRVPNLHQIIRDLFGVATRVLTPAGRMVFANPLRVTSSDPTLRLEYREVVDLGGFDCRLEVYRKVGRSTIR
ncbi:MAG: methyltransferase domain-containing protein [Pedosphaera sp.]|nr:methyltransferase domain-containing protein [Pedosphaera sp.]